MRFPFRTSLWLTVVGLVLALALPVAALSAQESSGTKLATVTRGGQTIVTTVIDEDLAPDGRPMRAGSLIVKFRPRSSELERDEAHRGSGARNAERQLARDTTRVDVPREEVAKALRSYRSHRSVQWAEPDYVARALFTPSDTEFAQQWGMTKIQAGAPASAPANSAWDISTSSTTTRVAILDCGIYHETTSTFLAPDGQPGHPDLRGPKLVASVNFSTSNNTDDFCNHGTHVAGIAAANTNNALGVAGVGFNASLVNVKVLGDNGSGSFTAINNGILWAAGCDTNPCGPPRAEVINMSLGATGPCPTSTQEAIDKAWQQGLVIAAAAGNSNKSGAITPANCNNVIGVSASDQNDRKARFSNFGPGVDVAAPGVSILSTDFVGTYSSFDGTSMASPHVAGLAALIWTTPHNTGNQPIVDRIFSTANLSALAGSTYGRIDACAAVACLAAPPGPPPADTTPPSVSINQAAGQADPTNASPINFTVVFSESVTGFDSNDVAIGGTAGGTKTVAVTGGPATYNVAVSGMTDGTVVATIPAGAATDLAANPNPSLASTSTDNSVTYDTTAPAVTIDQAAGQADPTSASSINFTVVFTEPATGFATGDVAVSGTAGGTKTVVVTGGPTIYNVAVSGMTSAGTVVATIPAGVAQDGAGNPNAASTSLDNTVTYEPPTCTATVASSTDTNPTGGGTVTINWSNSPGVTQVKVQRQKSDGTWATRATVNASTVTWTGNDLGSDPLWRLVPRCGGVDFPGEPFDPPT